MGGSDRIDHDSTGLLVKWFHFRISREGPDPWSPTSGSVHVLLHFMFIKYRLVLLVTYMCKCFKHLMLLAHYSKYQFSICWWHPYLTVSNHLSTFLDFWYFPSSSSSFFKKKKIVSIFHLRCILFIFELSSLIYAVKKDYVLIVCKNVCSK